MAVVVRRAAVQARAGGRCGWRRILALFCPWNSPKSLKSRRFSPYQGTAAAGLRPATLVPPQIMPKTLDFFGAATDATTDHAENIGLLWGAKFAMCQDQ
jgi:hypothetical protein